MQPKQSRQISPRAFVHRGKMGPIKTKKLFFYVTYFRKDIQGYPDFVERSLEKPMTCGKVRAHRSMKKKYY